MKILGKALLSVLFWSPLFFQQLQFLSVSIVNEAPLALNI